MLRHITSSPWRLLAALLATGASITLLVGLGVLNSSKSFRELHEELRLGMREDEVFAILGRPAEDKDVFGETIERICTWRQRGDHIQVSLTMLLDDTGSAWVLTDKMIGKSPQWWRKFWPF